MNKPSVYNIQIAGNLPDHWSHWFEELAIENDPHAGTTLSGPLADQAALFGVLNKIHALNLILISVNRVSQDERE